MTCCNLSAEYNYLTMCVYIQYCRKTTNTDNVIPFRFYTKIQFKGLIGLFKGIFIMKLKCSSLPESILRFNLRILFCFEELTDGKMKPLLCTFVNSRRLQFCLQFIEVK